MKFDELAQTLSGSTMARSRTTCWLTATGFSSHEPNQKMRKPFKIETRIDSLTLAACGEFMLHIHDTSKKCNTISHDKCYDLLKSCQKNGSDKMKHKVWNENDKSTMLFKWFLYVINGSDRKRSRWFSLFSTVSPNRNHLRKQCWWRCQGFRTCISCKSSNLSSIQLQVQAIAKQCLCPSLAVA